MSHSRISLEFYRAYRAHIVVTFLYRRHALSRVELRNMASRRNWSVF